MTVSYQKPSSLLAALVQISGAIYEPQSSSVPPPSLSPRKLFVSYSRLRLKIRKCHSPCVFFAQGQMLMKEIISVSSHVSPKSENPRSSLAAI